MSASNQDRALLDLAARLAAEAAATILAVRARGFATREKPDRTLVTEADHAAEAVIVAGLRAASAIPVVAEEEFAAGTAPAAAPVCWLVDPLDGTRDFAAGHDSFCVNIGLVRERAPVLGAIAVPATGEVFTALAGSGAWKRDAHGTRPIRVRAPPAQGLSVLASRRMQADSRLQAALAGQSVASVTHLGSAVKLCRIAEGAADVYVRFGRTMEWDTAAGQALLEAAGGALITMEGARLGYAKPGWINPGFIARGGPPA